MGGSTPARPPPMTVVGRLLASRRRLVRHLSADQHDDRADQHHRGRQHEGARRAMRLRRQLDLVLQGGELVVADAATGGLRLSAAASSAALWVPAETATVLTSPTRSSRRPAAWC